MKSVRRQSGEVDPMHAAVSVPSAFSHLCPPGICTMMELVVQYFASKGYRVCRVEDGALATQHTAQMRMKTR